MQIVIPEDARCPKCGPPRNTKLKTWPNTKGPTSTQTGLLGQLVATCDCGIAWAGSPVYVIPQYIGDTNVTEF